MSMKLVLKRSLYALAATLGILIVFGFVLGWLEARVNSRLSSALGWGAVLLTAAVGTPVHEICHWLMCKLFGLKVVDVALFRPVAARHDGVLGYVQYAWSESSLWQRLGCFFSGIAPLLLGVLVILLVVRLLTPEAWRGISEQLEEKNRKKVGNPFRGLWNGFLGFWSGIFSLRGARIIRGVLCVYIVLSISMHMTLSSADLHGALTGLPVLLLCYLIYGVVTDLLGTDYQKQAARCASLLLSFLSIGLICDIVLLILTWIVF